VFLRPELGKEREKEHCAMPDHVVYFFDSDADLVEAARRYLAEGLRQGDVSVVIATEAHRRAIAAELGETPGRPDMIQFWNATEILADVLVDGRPDPRRFQAAVGDRLRSLARTGLMIRAFGEMVALLWQQGNVTGAVDVERLWNDLCRRIGFSLLCVYPLYASRAVDNTTAYHLVVELHTSVVAGPPHLLAECSFPRDRQAPGLARHFVIAALRQRGWEDSVVDAAALAVTELTTNAILHAKSPFTVTLRANVEGVRIEVHDANPLSPRSGRRHPPLAEHGRGLCLVDSVAQRWGIEPESSGKVVWVELGR
jgi:anti-sigma regulatory factor (Ser/Thr protein kinase)